MLVVLLALLHVTQADSVERLQRWLAARCGPTGHSIWVFNGSLYDPLDGKEICAVSGLELVRGLAQTDGSLSGNQSFKKRCRDLHIADAVDGVDYAGTILSRKLFCYHGTDGRLLQSIRLRPGSPLKRIPMDQAAAVFDTASTFVLKGRKCIVHGEWPDGRSVWSSADWRGSNDDLEFTVYAKPRKGLIAALMDLAQPGNPESVSPRRSSIVQFGPSASENGGLAGARETYQYALEAVAPPSLAQRLWSRLRRPGSEPEIFVPSCRVRYTRYGEGPVWYGPHRMCTLELHGRRVNRIDEIPSTLARIAASHVPGFMSVHGPVTADDDLAGRHVDWFRGKGSEALALVDHEIQPTRRENLQRKLSGIVERVKRATINDPFYVDD